MKQLLIILSLFFAVQVSGQHHMMHVLSSESGVDLTTGLVSLWEFDETSGTTATDAHGTNDGTISGATVNQTGLINQAYSYDGTSDQVSVPDNNSLDFEYNSSFSYSLWVNINSASNLIIFLAKQASIAPYRGYNLFYDPGAATLKAELISDNSPQYLLENAYSFSPTLSTWYLFTVTYDGTQTNVGLNLYVNGIKQTYSSTINTLGSNTILNTTPLYIGARNLTNSMNGLIDQVAIWNIALTQEQVTALYNSGNGKAYTSF